MAAPLVSVIIAVYNDPVRLPRSVASICAQSFADWEILIANDGSSDGTLAVAADLAGSDPRIHVLDLPHAGVARARNAAAQAARGEWLAIQDSDDYSVPLRLERQLAALREQPTVGVLASYGKRVSDGRARGVVGMGPTSIEEFRQHRARHPTYVINGTAMIRRETFLDAGGYPEDYRVGEDLALYSLRMAPRCDILVLPEPLVSIEVHSDSLSRAFAEEIVQADDVVRLNLERRSRGQDLLDYQAALRELGSASLLASLDRRRRTWRHAWFARGAADLSAGSIRGLPRLIGALAIAPWWTAGRVLPRFTDYWRVDAGR